MGMFLKESRVLVLNMRAYLIDKLVVTAQNKSRYARSRIGRDNGLDERAAQTGKTFLSISFLSTKGSSPVGHPYGLAKTLDAELMDMTDPLNGWIVVDFGSPAIAARIYETNFNH